MRLALAILLALALAPAAVADVKTYSSDPPGGTPGDRLTSTFTLSPKFIPAPKERKGDFQLTDAGLGVVTLDAYSQGADTIVDIDTTGRFGPGGFIFIISTGRGGPTAGQTGAGGTTSGSSIAWGVISGWTTSGVVFCLASPTSVCTANAFTHGVTVANTSTSSTFDIGTWSFDAVGDMTATPYITRTNNAGLSNTQNLTRGALTGSSLPAMPLVGFGALALSLLVVGGRAVIRKK